MAFITILGIAIGLGMDAFAVSVSSGCQLRKATWKQTMRMALAFGFFQAIMPVLGWTAGLVISRLVETVAPWIAFGLLTIVGVHMLVEGIKNNQDDDCSLNDPTQGWRLLTLSIATSIDAFAVGVSLSLLRLSVWIPAVIIGIAAFIMSVIGMRIGCSLGNFFGRRVEIIGGIILLFIAGKVIIQLY